MPAVGRRDSASAFSAAALRCVALLLACCAGKRFAFPRLRTLAGSRIPPLAHKKAPWAVMGSGRSIIMAGTEGFRVRLVGGRVPLRRFASCVLRWKTLRVSSAPHPCGFEFLRLPTRKRSRFIRAWSAVFLRAGTEGFEPPTAGTKNRSSTVELRPNVWCCPKATRLVYLICEGIANAVE